MISIKFNIFKSSINNRDRKAYGVEITLKVSRYEIAMRIGSLECFAKHKGGHRQRTGKPRNASNEISKLLGISPPAVCQYVSKKRGYSIEFGEKAKASISKLADDLINNRIDDPRDRICEICRMLREDEAVDNPDSCGFL